MRIIKIRGLSGMRITAIPAAHNTGAPINGIMYKEKWQFMLMARA